MTTKQSIYKQNGQLLTSLELNVPLFQNMPTVSLISIYLTCLQKSTRQIQMFSLDQVFEYKYMYGP